MAKVMKDDFIYFIKIMSWVFLAGSFCERFLFHNEIYIYGIVLAVIILTWIRPIESRRKRGCRHEVQ